MNRNGNRSGTFRIQRDYSSDAVVTLYEGDRLELLAQVPTGEARLVVTSPPYNIGKKYERRLTFEHYLEDQKATLQDCYRILARDGSLCWQVLCGCRHHT